VSRGERTRRVGDQIQRELSTLIRNELRDPRVGLVTLTGVKVSPDMAHAWVYYTCLDPAHVKSAGLGLTHSAGFLRAQLARRIRLYAIPALHFAYDASIEQGDHLSRLIDSVSGPDKSP